jgi:type II secretory ATPase GspE/PulE/Tfp pilus assembly ATPase PilB-like protein
MRTDGALNTIATFVKAVGDPELAGSALRGVVAEKLMRKLCENCKVPYQPSAEMLAKLGLPAEKVQKLFKKGGQVLIKNKEEVCPVCAGTGYQGQVGVFEVYALGEEEQRAIRSADMNALRAALRKKNLPTLQQAALMKAVGGITSVEEVTRVTVPQKPPASKA